MGVFLFIFYSFIMPISLISSPLQAVTIITNSWNQSLRFYTDGLAYSLLTEGELTPSQKKAFGKKLGKYALLGYKEGAIVRLIELKDRLALPNRLNANPWDTGMCVLEAGTPDVMSFYRKMLSMRFGAISQPLQFSAKGEEPLGEVEMKSVAFFAPSGEQIFVTEIVRRLGGISLLKDKAIQGVNVPANVVISMQDRNAMQAFWTELLGISPVNDLPLHQAEVPIIMGGIAGMGFDMCLMGYGKERIGLEQHVYGKYNPLYTFKNFPCHFSLTGLACATWQTSDIQLVKKKSIEANFPLISEIGLPIRHQTEPEAIVLRGSLGEIIELVK